ncbi:TPA: glycosyltransferase family 2 protein [Photobacterium damselae]
MNNNKLLSIIIPCFNASKYIENLLASFFINRHANVEFIFIDDGSSDKTVLILEEYQKKHKIDIVKIPKNRGVSFARNAGLNLAKGDFLWFIDSDDLLLENAIDIVINAILTNYENDLIIFDYQKTKGDRKETISVPNLVSVNYKELFYLFNVGGVSYQLWNKVFKREVIKNEFDVELLILEDMDFILNFIIKDNLKCRLINKAVYNYFQRDSSAINTITQTKLNNMDVMFEKLGCFIINSKDKRLLPSYKNKKIENVYFQLVHKNKPSAEFPKLRLITDGDIMFKNKIKLVVSFILYKFSFLRKKHEK